MVRYCLELPYGALKHFPAGTYNEQMSTVIGRLELELMQTVHTAWYMFEHLGPSKWEEPERRFMMWLEGKPKPQPTMRAEFEVERIWSPPWWLTLVMEQLRGANAVNN